MFRPCTPLRRPFTHPYLARGYKPLATWIDAGNGYVPLHQGGNEAVIGGYDVSGENLYIGRSEHNGEIIPGKIVPSHGCLYLPYGGEEHAKHQYQVLTHSNSAADFVWSEAFGGAVPTGAIQGGVSNTGERLFIGRVRHEGSICIGKVHPSHGTLYISFGGREHGYNRYEVLCVKCIPLEH